MEYNKLPAHLRQEAESGNVSSVAFRTAINSRIKSVPPADISTLDDFKAWIESIPEPPDPAAALREEHERALRALAGAQNGAQNGAQAEDDAQAQRRLEVEIAHRRARTARTADETFPLCDLNERDYIIGDRVYRIPDEFSLSVEYSATRTTNGTVSATRTDTMNSSVDISIDNVYEDVEGEFPRSFIDIGDFIGAFEEAQRTYINSDDVSYDGTEIEMDSYSDFEDDGDGSELEVENVSAEEDETAVAGLIAEYLFAVRAEEGHWELVTTNVTTEANHGNG